MQYDFKLIGKVVRRNLRNEGYNVIFTRKSGNYLTLTLQHEDLDFPVYAHVSLDDYKDVQKYLVTSPDRYFEVQVKPSFLYRRMEIARWKPDLLIRSSEVPLPSFFESYKAYYDSYIHKELNLKNEANMARGTLLTVGTAPGAYIQFERKGQGEGLREAQVVQLNDSGILEAIVFAGEEIESFIHLDLVDVKQVMTLGSSRYLKNMLREKELCLKSLLRGKAKHPS